MLTVHSSETVDLKPRCVVKMDQEAHSFTDFVTVAHDATIEGGFRLLQNADAVTLGVAAQMTMKAFKDAYVELTPEQRLDVDIFFHGSEVLDYHT